MKYHEVRVLRDHAYLLPIGDLHIGDRNFDKSLLEKNIAWVKKTPNARVILMGDILNCATRGSKSSPFCQDMTLQAQIDMALKYFKPIQTQIIGCISGNHEQRLEDFAGFNPLSALCLALDCPYFGSSVALAIRVGKGAVKIAYIGYAHHTVGGGSTPGSKINRVNQLRSIVSNADFYLGAHNHALGAMPTTTRCVDVAHKSIQLKRQMLIDCGSYLKWEDGYAEMKALEPTKLGSPRIRLNGIRRDIHVSL